MLLYTDDFTSCESSLVTLIDFGIAKKLPMNKEKAHQALDFVFEGNLIFGSLSQIQGYGKYSSPLTTV